jgi:hypothetical protein
VLCGIISRDDAMGGVVMINSALLFFTASKIMTRERKGERGDIDKRQEQ